MYVDLKLKRIGGSLFGRIPAAVARELGWKAEETVRVKAERMSTAEILDGLMSLKLDIPSFKRDPKDWDRKIG
ncbi:MAG: hypothetical protein V1708_03680 [Candidatus Micrarchaeota archaeon]